MHKADPKTPSSFTALIVGLFIGALLVLPMFAYICRVNWKLRQENLRLNVRVVQQAHKIVPPPNSYEPTTGPVRYEVDQGVIVISCKDSECLSNSR